MCTDTRNEVKPNSGILSVREVVTPLLPSLALLQQPSSSISCWQQRDWVFSPIFTMSSAFLQSI